MSTLHPIPTAQAPSRIYLVTPSSPSLLLSNVGSRTRCLLFGMDARNRNEVNSRIPSLFTLRRTRTHACSPRNLVPPSLRRHYLVTAQKRRHCSSPRLRTSLSEFISLRPTGGRQVESLSTHLYLFVGAAEVPKHGRLSSPYYDYTGSW